MENIEQNIARVQQQIRQAASTAGRHENEIMLLAVSKTKPVSDIRTAYDQGLRHFGENYLQHAEAKILELKDLEDIHWHFIGPIQSNKTRRISELFDWVHSIERLKIAHRLHEQRPPSLPPLNVLLQVNIDAEPSKAGIPPDEVMALANEVQQFSSLRLRGLMAIPSISSDYEQQCIPFARMKELFDELQAKYPTCDTLSMGMSADMQAAIAQGSTLVRIGTAIFGARTT